MTDLVGLAGQMGVGMARVPLRRPWTGQGNLAHNVAVAVTRETIRTFMGYSTSLPIDQFRSIELVLDDLSGAVLSPVVRFRGADHEEGSVGGVLGEWIRPRKGRSGGTILYLHGGGYVGTSPHMYTVFAAWLARRTGCDIFVPDLRLAPEFPFPADLEDATAALRGLLASGIAAEQLVIAGDSSGGGLATTPGRRHGRARRAAGGRRRPLLARGEPAARPPLGARQRQPRHPALEHPDVGLPPRRQSGVAPGVGGRTGPRGVATDLRVLRRGRDVP